MENKKTQKWSGNTEPTTMPLYPKKEPKTRAFPVTSWEEPIYDNLQMKYLVCGKEIAPTTGRIHWQTFVYFHNAKTFKEVLNYFKKRKIHVEFSKGSIAENIAYCTKDDDYVEYGIRPSQGARTDLLEIGNEIAKGKKVDDICLENPVLYHQYGRTLNKLEALYQRTQYRTEMTTCEWIYGPTGVGKSHKAFLKYHPTTHYNLPDDGGWWDGYDQQKYVIINEYRGHIKYDKLLELIDKTPLSVRRRGREPCPFTSKHVIITSSLSPQDVYCNRMEGDSIEQLLRRIVVTKMNKVYFRGSKEDDA